MDDDSSIPCWFCRSERPDPPPGGWLMEDEYWRVGHVPASYAVAGTIVLEARRHVTDQTAMDQGEAATLVGVTGRAMAAVAQVTGCDRVYQWATMDAFAHFHLWLVPWWASGPLRGPRYLVDAVVDGPGCTAEEALATAGRLREALGRHAGPAIYGSA